MPHKRREVEPIIPDPELGRGIKAVRAESGCWRPKGPAMINIGDGRIMAYFPTYLTQDAAAAVPVIRRIKVKNIREALEEGVRDFWAMPSHAAFLALVYPLCGMVLAYAPSYQNALQLIFPLASGFALVGPFVAVGLYEMSRRRELGLEISWKHAFNVVRSPSLPSIAALGSVLLTIFATGSPRLSGSTRRSTAPRRPSALSTSSSKSPPLSAAGY
jgi:hypothetical protein